MPHDWPELPDLLVTVREFLDDLTPRLEGQDRYHALCAAYLLNIAGRELKEWSRPATQDDARLAALVPDSELMSPAEVVSALCRDIRAGKHDERLPELMTVMHAHVSSKVRVSRPEYLDESSDVNSDKQEFR